MGVFSHMHRLQYQDVGRVNKLTLVVTGYCVKKWLRNCVEIFFREIV